MDLNDYAKFVAALVFVLALMAGLGMVLKRIGLGPGSMLSSDKRRLKIIEILPLDARRRAVLLRRDNAEHLVILGPSGETVVETHIATPDPTDASKQTL